MHLIHWRYTITFILASQNLPTQFEVNNILERLIIASVKKIIYFSRNKILLKSIKNVVLNIFGIEYSKTKRNTTRV